MTNHLLAIDDEPELLALLSRTAKAWGYTVDTTTDPEVFKTVARTGEPNIILIDLQMPGYDGVELLEFLAAQQCRAAIVLSSGFDTRVVNISRELGKKLGLNMANPLPKPVRATALRATLDEYRSSPFEIDAGALREAIDDGQLELHFQPLVDLRERRLIGWEGLVRWQHPKQGMIMPDRFIRLAERNGLIDPLSDRVAELAVRQLADWNGDGRNAFISINLSAQNLADAQLPDRLERLCVQHNVPPILLRLELTETAAMADPIRVIAVLTRLRLKGFELAIDDFGTGYSSLLQLHRLPFSELKIDQSFVRFMRESEEAKLIVGLTITLAHGLRMQVIAEGVETGDLAEQLAADGCDIAQGYHFGKPMPAANTQAWMTRNLNPA
jgi:EAL domain-containing protein (putative c-di-GMP-specific phosphodiesterase class I)/ActR/RegA family two-component response regulator